MPLDQRGFEIPAETKPHDVFSLEGLRDWLMKQPKDGEYFYQFPQKCLITKYVNAMGGKMDLISDIYIVGSEMHPVCLLIKEESGLRDVAFHSPWTFGAEWPAG